MQTDDKIQIIDGMTVMSEAIGFETEEMIPCGKCSKPNPPNRLNCFYCGDALELPAEVAAGLRFQPTGIEDWEPGVNIACLGAVDLKVAGSAESSIAMDSDLPASLTAAEPPFPVIRVRAEDAEEVAARLSSSGMQVRQIQDRSLNLDQPPTRLKGMVFETDPVEFRLFNSDQAVRVAAADIALIVSGAIFKSSSEATIKKKRKETRHVDEKFDASDHSVIDIYTAHDHRGFRILPHGFDFSCLGDKKSLLAVENFKRLKELLRAAFPNAVFDDSYVSKLFVLDRVWPRTVTNTSKGIYRVVWKMERSVGESVSNEGQFTRYSRMRRELI